MLSAVKVYLRIAWALKTPFIFPLDKNYKTINLLTLEQVANQVKAKFTYIADFSDCDDAAWRFKAVASTMRENAVGLVFGWASWAHCLHCLNT